MTNPDLPQASAGDLGWRRALERVIVLAIHACGVSAIVFVFGIFVFVFVEASGILWGGLNFLEFFTSPEWRPVSDPPRYGAFRLIVGTLSVTAIAMLLAVPFGLGTAVLISEFCRPRIREALKVVIELLAAIPSVVWGFVGYTALSTVIRVATGADSGTNALNAGVILALMSLPIIVSIGEDALKAVPDSYREAAEALGATKWQIVYRVLFPAAKSGLLAAVLLGVGRAVGETMAVYMATGDSIQNPFQGAFPFFDPVTPVKTLTATIAAEMGEASEDSDHRKVLFVIGLLLFAITFAINLTADLIVKGIRRR
jgi:phosphate transport system permease protein